MRIERPSNEAKSRRSKQVRHKLYTQHQDVFKKNMNTNLKLAISRLRSLILMMLLNISTFNCVALQKCFVYFSVFSKT